MSANTLLITGGAGFIGSALVRYLLAHTSCRVVNVDKLTYAASLQALQSVQHHPRYAFEQADIADRTAMQTVFRRYQPSAVMHLAAESHVDRSIGAPDAFIQSNIVGTYTLLEASRQHWQALPVAQRQAFRFLHVSTDEVYGDLGDGDGLFSEVSSYAPSSPYSASKAGADHLVRAWHRTYGLPVLVTNCSNNYGPWQFPEKLIPATVARALAGKPLAIYGDGHQVRDWLYVEDHVRALFLVLQKGRVGQTYAIGGKSPLSNLAVVGAICDVLDDVCPRCDVAGLEQLQKQPTGISVAPSYRALITHVADRAGHDRRYAIDSSKVRRELGWEPAVPFEQGLRQTVLWYLKHRSWLAGRAPGLANPGQY